jgi:hypothetical protein
VRLAEAGPSPDTNISSFLTSAAPFGARAARQGRTCRRPGQGAVRER